MPRVFCAFHRVKHTKEDTYAALFPGAGREHRAGCAQRRRTRTGRHGFRGPDRPGSGPRPAQGAACQILPRGRGRAAQRDRGPARAGRHPLRTRLFKPRHRQARHRQGHVPARGARLQPALPLLLCLHGRLPRRALASAAGDGQESARLAGGPFRQPPSIGGGLLRRRTADELRRGARPGALRPRTGKEARQAFPTHHHHQRPGPDRRAHRVFEPRDAQHRPLHRRPPRGARLHAPHGQRQGLVRRGRETGEEAGQPARRRAVLRARHLHRPQPRLWQRRAGAGRRGF